MRITRKQYKTFNRMNKKLKTIPLFFIANYGYLMKKYSYLKKSHYIVKCQLKFKKEKVIIVFNQLKKLGVQSKVEKEGKKQYSKKHQQKKCHKQSKTVKNSAKKPKSKREVRVTTNNNVDQNAGTITKVPIQCEAHSTTDIETTPQPIEESITTRNVKVIEADSNEVVSTSGDVNEQIREQLKLLQSGRRSSIALLTNNGNSTRPSSVLGTKTSSCSSTPSYSRHLSHSSLESEPIKSSDEKSTKTDGTKGTSTHVFNQRPKFIDSLINKLKTQGLNLPTTINDDIQSLSTPTSPEKSITNASQKSLTECESSMDVINDDSHLSDHSTSSKNDFLGFKEDEAQFERPNIPGMLPTPVVKKSKGVKSAFVSEELDNFMKENALDNSSYKTAPLKKRHDEAMMYAEAEPPSLLCPQLPSDVEKPRTVAEKRQLLEKKADIRYLMIENESTVYRELRKRSKAGPVPNYTLIRNIQQMNIPFTRDCWRATCWLNTPNGRFYYQTIQENGKDIKVLGGRGNNAVKELVKLPPIRKKKFIRQDCSETCKLVGNIKINGLDELLSESTKLHSGSSEMTFTSKKLNTLSDSYSFQKPGPLSLKKLNPIKSSIDVELGPLELFNLPHIQLQVWPKLDRPLPDVVHPYLKLALPYHKITPEWAEFALSTLKQITPPNRRKRKQKTEIAECNRSFTFNIPYANNQNRILVRKRRQIVPMLAKLNSIKETEKTQLSFRQNVDKTDKVAVAVADVLTDMINSVALTLCEATVIKDDPDIDYGRVDAEIGSGDNKLVGINAVDGKKKNTPGGKIVKELKKLNAKIIHGFDTIKREECKNAFCELGCICDSLRGAQTYSYHCKEVNCMFQCKCPSSKINTSTFESAVHNSDIKQFCDRMNASLAKEEKDFTATVVVSDGKTIYVPTWDEKKKRNKKVPKRLSDCVQFENEFVHRDLSETLITKEEKRMRQKLEVVEEEKKLLITDKNDIVKNMIHVNVNVERLNTLDSLQPWCMVHCLYKCFCNCRLTVGDRFEFGNPKIDIIEQPAYTKKRQYTFERNKDEPPYKMPKTTKYVSTPFPTIVDDDYSSCRRVRVVATNQYKIVNRARAEDIRRRVKKIEQDHPGLKVLLRNRIKRSTALAEIGPLVTVADSSRDANVSGTSKENRSMLSKNRSECSVSMGSDAMEQSIEKSITSSSLPANDSFKVDTTSHKYRSRFNNIIMKTMQGISHKLKTMVTLPSPVNKAFYYMQWKHFLHSFSVDQLYVWEVQLNTQEVLLVVTDKNIMPIVSNAMYVINIKAVSSERLPLLPKLIKLGVINDETDKMSILLFGISNYWRVLGCTHSENDFLNNQVVAVPTPDTNPRLASKISYLFNDMVQLTAKNRAPAKQTQKFTTNICIRQIDDVDIEKIHVPIPVVGCHRWLMLTLANDFSHIFVPSWKQFLSHKKIQCAIEHANKTQKTVRMGPADLKPHVYVPHNAGMKIFFGPLEKNESLDLQLLQQCDGKMLLREDYQRITKQEPNVLTIGTWLYMKDDHMMADNSSENIDLTNDSMTEANSMSDVPPKYRTYPPKLKFFTKSSSTVPGFIPLKPSTITSTSSNFNITLMSPTSAADSYSTCTTSTPSTSNAVPSSELIRQLSLGLRARPAKVPTTPNIDSTMLPNSSTRPNLISVKDPSFLMSPASSSHSWTTSTPSVTTSIQSKPITMSLADNISFNSATNSKEIRKVVPIRGRRYTTIVSTGGKPILKSMLQKPIDTPSTSVKNIEKVELEASNVQDSNPVTQPITQPSKRIGIRERRYTTIVSSDGKSGLRNILPKPFIVRPPPVTVKNFELVQNEGNKLTLAPIPSTSSTTQRTLNRPVIIKQIDFANSPNQPNILHQTSQSNDRSQPVQLNLRPLSPLNKQTNVKPSTIPSKLSTVSVIKPSSFNLNLPPKGATAIVSDGKAKKFSTLRLIPGKNLKLASTAGPSNPKKKTPNVVDTTEIIDSDDDEIKPPPLKKPHTTIKSIAPPINIPINGYFISQIRSLGKVLAKKLLSSYSIYMLDGTKLFQTAKHCTDYLTNTYIKERVFALVPAQMNIEWKFVVNEEDHASYDLHNAKMLRTSMVLTKDELIDLNSDFDANEGLSMDLRHHLLVLRLAHACMKNFEARHKTGLAIVKKSETVIKELLAENTKLESTVSALRIEKHLNTLKLSNLRKKTNNVEVITIDSDDDD